MLLFRQFLQRSRNLAVHRLDERVALFLLPRDCGKHLHHVLDTFITLAINDQRLDAACLKRIDEFLIHPLVDDDEIRLAGQHLLCIDLVDLADRGFILRVVRHLRLGVRAPDDIAADFMQRL